jgi:hypothetical protein
MTQVEDIALERATISEHVKILRASSYGSNRIHMQKVFCIWIVVLNLKDKNKMTQPKKTLKSIPILRIS